MHNFLILSVLTVAATAATLNYEEPSTDLPRRNNSRYADLRADIESSRSRT